MSKPKIEIGFFQMFSAVSALAEGLNSALKDGKLSMAECSEIIARVIKALDLDITVG